MPACRRFTNHEQCSGSKCLDLYQVKNGACGRLADTAEDRPLRATTARTNARPLDRPSPDFHPSLEGRGAGFSNPFGQPDLAFDLDLVLIAHLVPVGHLEFHRATMTLLPIRPGLADAPHDTGRRTPNLGARRISIAHANNAATASPRPSPMRSPLLRPPR